MSDIFDRASVREDEDRTRALAAQRARGGLHGKTAADSALFCRECAASMLPARRKALPGVQTCVDCQQILEKQRSVYGRQ